MMGTGGDMSWRNRFKFFKKCKIVKSNRQSQEKKRDRKNMQPSSG